ncbi:imidazole glycerol phosphate synthase subunit HisH [Polymorphobacter arshaanensis]|uniref:Imidazole glycerol phosphate synthase subunit HisH n=1 Tax=Glacieibacterium arshaanense TaxID=2511025 RepID=A0A4Y9EKJ3_9SPHN|nr:imidazole glycerol phosphate synthase subunit HisH [Polymorphobacter arshaanensis]TFU01283.1 imidazole glycerol phosphate synthase subunit HisH [Polymorphobacter arshaanensis]
MTVVIDYGAGNLRSVAKALEAVGADVTVTGDPAVVAAADRIVLPGVGAFGQCIGALRGIGGLEDALTHAVKARGVPFLGICVGMQLLATEGHEHGVHAGLGWIDGIVERMHPAALKVPHMGWNTLAVRGQHPVLAGMDGVRAYYVHSYRFKADNSANVLAVSDYGGEVAAVTGRDNLLGVQFHPEKSQTVGLGFLARFLEWAP